MQGEKITEIQAKTAEICTTKEIVTLNCDKELNSRRIGALKNGLKSTRGKCWLKFWTDLTGRGHIVKAFHRTSFEEKHDPCSFSVQQQTSSSLVVAPLPAAHQPLGTTSY
jgi:hypothetical protein